MDSIAKFMGTNIPVTVKYHVQKSIFALDPVKMNRGVFRFMSLYWEKNVTRRSWDTIPKYVTDITLIKELSYNEPNQFLCTYIRGFPIGYVNIIGVDRDSDDSNKNQSPQDPPHELQAIKETKEDPVIPDKKLTSTSTRDTHRTGSSIGTT